MLSAAETIQIQWTVFNVAKNLQLGCKNLILYRCGHDNFNREQEFPSRFRFNQPLSSLSVRETTLEYAAGLLRTSINLRYKKLEILRCHRATLFLNQRENSNTQVNLSDSLRYLTLSQVNIEQVLSFLRLRSINNLNTLRVEYSGNVFDDITQQIYDFSHIRVNSLQYKSLYVSGIMISSFRSVRNFYGKYARLSLMALSIIDAKIFGIIHFEFCCLTIYRSRYIEGRHLFSEDLQIWRGDDNESYNIPIEYIRLKSEVELNEMNQSVILEKYVIKLELNFRNPF